MPDLSDKTALVTGAGRGLGRAVALGLAGCGARVALVARHEEQLAETAAAIRALGREAHVLPADVSRPAAVEALHAEVLARIAPPAIVVNAAGVFGPIAWIKDSDPNAWIETLAINTIGPYLVCRAFLGAMVARGWGRIINFSSAASLHTPGPLNSAYGTSKVALNQFTRHLAAELAGTGVTANVIHPGEVQTAMWAEIRDVAAAAGPAGKGYRSWAEEVAKTGGDDPQKTVDLVLKLVDEQSATTTGKFLWIADGMQRPIPSWGGE